MSRLFSRSLRALVLCLFSATLPTAGAAGHAISAVGIKQVELLEPGSGRRLALAIFYPAAVVEPDRRSLFNMPFFIHLALYKDAPLAAGPRRPLVVLSHGRASNPFYYAWFAQTLASRGYIVAGLYHDHANSYDSNIVYLANKLWQRPVDVRSAITLLLQDPQWGPAIDPRKIGVAGHSQGGFTALWAGGATVNRDKYLAFQRGWKANAAVPASLRAEMPLDPTPALHVHDSRIKAVFAMAPGVVKAFGMDAAGLHNLAVPTYIVVGAGDTVTPSRDNAAFAARYAQHATLHTIAGHAGHNVFANECDRDGKDELPEACVDDPGVDRAAIHHAIGQAALDFFNAHL